MKFVLASLVGLATAWGSSSSSSSSSSSYECPAEFRYQEDKGCVRICTLGENGVQASFRGKDDDN